MKLKLASIVIAATLASQAYADKPAWAGQGKPTDAQKAEHKAAMQAKDDSAEAADDIEQRIDKEQKILNKEKHQQKASEKNQKNKMLQEQKELDKGSEQGQQQREKRKKWWRFWGSEES